MSPGRRRFEVDPELYPFDSRWLERDGSAMHYVDTGDGTPVLMLHGNPTWSFLYRNVIRALDGACRCIAPDYPGFGFSDHPPGYGYTPEEHAGWVGALVDELGLHDTVLVVQDWGGPIGMAVAVDRPERVAGLVVCNTWAWPPRAFLRLFSLLMGSRVPGRWLNVRQNWFVRNLLMGMLPDDVAADARVRHAYRAPFPTPASREGTWVFPRAIRGAADWLAALEPRLASLSGRPVELVWAMKDPAFGTEKELGRWLRHFPDAGVDRLPDAGHYVQEDAPERVAAAVRRVLDRA